MQVLCKGSPHAREKRARGWGTRFLSNPHIATTAERVGLPAEEGCITSEPITSFLKRYYWMVASPFYCFFAFWVLQQRSPIRFDGSGAMATFYWGKHNPSASLAEYFGSSYIRREFMYPYVIGAIIMTLSGCGFVGMMVHALRPKRSRLFMISFGTCFVTLLAVAAASDSGTVLHLWNGPLLWAAPILLLSISIPMSLLSGLLSLAEQRLRMDEGWPAQPGAPAL